MKQAIQQRREGHLAIFLFSFLVAGSFSFGKLIADEIDPVALTAVRFLLAALLISVMLGVSGRLKLSDFRQPWRYFVLGGLFSAYFVLMFQALRLTTSLNTSVIFTTMPLAAAAVDRFIFKRMSRTIVWVALIVGAVGALWVVFEGSWAAFLSFSIGRGEVLFFVGTLAHAAYAVLIPRLRREEPVFATTLGVTTAAAFILVVLFWPRISNTDWGSVGFHVWGTLAYLVVMTTVVTLALVTFATSRLTSAKVTAYTYLTPFWVVLLDAVLGQGFPSLIVLIGGIPIAMALTLLFVERS